MSLRISAPDNSWKTFCECTSWEWLGLCCNYNLLHCGFSVDQNSDHWCKLQPHCWWHWVNSVHLVFPLRVYSRICWHRECDRLKLLRRRFETRNPGSKFQDPFDSWRIVSSGLNQFEVSYQSQERFYILLKVHRRKSSESSNNFQEALKMQLIETFAFNSLKVFFSPLIKPVD